MAANIYLFPAGIELQEERDLCTVFSYKVETGLRELAPAARGS